MGTPFWQSLLRRARRCWAERAGDTDALGFGAEAPTDALDFGAGASIAADALGGGAEAGGATTGGRADTGALDTMGAELGLTGSRASP